MALIPKVAKVAGMHGKALVISILTCLFQPNIYGVPSMKCHMSQKLSSNIKYIKSSGLFGVHIALYYVIW